MAKKPMSEERYRFYLGLATGAAFFSLFAVCILYFLFR